MQHFVLAFINGVIISILIFCLFLLFNFLQSFKNKLKNNNTLQYFLEILTFKYAKY